MPGPSPVPLGRIERAVKWNPEKFPGDFVFQLTLEETETVQRSRSHIVIMKRGLNMKYLPYVFIEHGAIMAANVLNSPRAVQMSVFVVRAFVRLWEMLGTHQDLTRKLEEIEKKYYAQLKIVFDTIRQLMVASKKAPRAIAVMRGRGGES